MYSSELSSAWPEMISGVRASSIRMESTSSTTAKFSSRWNALFQAERHVVAQVVEAEFVVGAVGDVGGIGGTLLLRRLERADDADGEAEELVQRTHPVGVAARQVVVDGDHVHALAGQRVQVDRQGRDQGLALTGTHFGDLALVQDHAADQLDVEVTHAHHALASLADDGEGLGQDLVEGLALGDALP